MRRNESEKAYLKGKNLWKINTKEMQKNMREEIQQERFLKKVIIIEIESNRELSLNNQKWKVEVKNQTCP